MQNRPNLDYDPGPKGASYSRVGPPPAEAPGDRAGGTGGRFTQEAAAELGLTVNRRRLKPKR